MLVWQAQQIQSNAALLAATVQRVAGLEAGYVTMSSRQEREAEKTARLELDVSALKTDLQVVVSTTREMHQTLNAVNGTLSTWEPRGIKIDHLLEETETSAERAAWAASEAKRESDQAEARRKTLARRVGLFATVLAILGSLAALVTTAAGWGPLVHAAAGFVGMHQLASMVVAASGVAIFGAVWIWWLIGAQNRAAAAGTMQRRRDDRSPGGPPSAHS